MFSGAGLGLIFLPQVTIVTEWFDKRLSFATGIAVCGSGFGMAIFALMSDWLIQEFNWRGAMLILAVMMFLCVLFSCTFRDPPYKRVANEKLRREASFKNAIRETFNFKILRNPIFAYFVIINSIASAAYYVPMLITTDRITRLKLGNTRDAAGLWVFFGISNGIARTVFGYISDMPGVNRTLLYAMAVFSMGVVMAFTNFASSLVQMQMLYIGLGITEGKCRPLIQFCKLCKDYDEQTTLFSLQAYTQH